MNMLLERAIKQAPSRIDAAITRHRQAFVRQMQEKVGVEHISLEEPYLPYVRARQTLRYLARLAKLESRLVTTKAEDHEPLRVTIYPWPRGGSGVGEENDEYDFEDLDYDLEDAEYDDEDDDEEEDDDDDAEEDDEFQSELDDALADSDTETSQQLDSFSQQEFGIEQYVWHTQGDDKVRESHAAKDGQVFVWSQGEKPGDAYGCRCSAEPVLEGASSGNIFADITKDQILESALLLASLAPQGRAATIGIRAVVALGRTGRAIISAARSRAGRIGGRAEKPTSANYSKDAEKIANGHAYDKHVKEQNEFPEIKTRIEFQKYIENIMKNPSEVKNLQNNRTAFWDDKNRVIVILDPKNADGGTIFKPTSGKIYFDKLK